MEGKMNIKSSLVLSLIAVSPLVLHAATSPIRFGGTDSERIEKAIAEACRTGERGVCIGKMTAGAFVGLRGAKLWFVGGHKGEQSVSLNYLRILEGHRGYYDSVVKMPTNRYEPTSSRST